MAADEAQRASPDALLARANKEGRGHLKIFLGAAPGVGKTYAMLTAAAQREGRRPRCRRRALVETHGRRETEQLIDGFEILPRKPIVYRNQMMKEFDLDAALARGVRACCWSTNTPTPTCPAAGIPSAGRTSTNCCTPASTSGPRSIFSIDRALCRAFFNCFVCRIVLKHKKGY